MNSPEVTTQVVQSRKLSGTLNTTPSRRAYWIRQVVLWHWVSSAVCLSTMLLFTVTGITLNHAAQIPAKAVVQKKQAVLPAELASSLRNQPADGRYALPAPVASWAAAVFPEKNLTRLAEWSATEIYLSLPRPGGDGWLTIDRETGAVEWERTERGWIAYLNDLHKGRHTGWVWQAFIDVVAVAFLVFTATGIILLQVHSSKRPSTWPVVLVGFAVPLVLVLLFLHV